jgi:hypothetical protein
MYGTCVALRSRTCGRVKIQSERRAATVSNPPSELTEGLSLGDSLGASARRQSQRIRMELGLCLNPHHLRRFHAHARAKKKGSPTYSS